MFLTLDALPVE